jgi:ubiquinone/menaquinone biosynthesis C-methylase UbiE
MKKINLITKNHKKTKRNYIERMNNNKVFCMNIAKKYSKDYWDGKRRFGYGGYRYIPGRLEIIAKYLYKKFLNKKNAKVLDLGCGKGYLLYELLKLDKNLDIYGIDVSKYAIKNAKPEIKKKIKMQDARSKLQYKKNFFDLVISINTLHNFNLIENISSIKEISRVSKNAYIAVESYRNNKELFNLQCWALTCESFFSPNEWEYLFRICKLKGEYEFIFFE